MSVDKLTSLHLTQQLLCVSAHIAGSYLITHDLPLGIDDKGTAFCKAVRLDQHLKVLRNAVGRVCQHGVIDLLNALGCIVPCLVDKMGIGRYRIDLTADGLELLVLVSQILQFGGTYKGKVRRIEEEHAPFAKNVFLAYKLKFVFMIGIGAKFRDFLIDHRHIYFLHKSC